MTTESQTQDAPEAPAEGSGAPEGVEAGANPEPPALEAPPEVPFWQRPYVERYLVPFLLPFGIVVGLVLFVLNISRIFLANHGTKAVVLGTIITIVILAGATVLSAASERLRSSSMGLATAAFIAVIALGGWLALGHAEGEGEGDDVLLANDGPALGELGFESLPSLRFVPDEVTTETGIQRITMTNVGGPHTFVFETPGTRFETLVVDAAGEVDTGRAFFGDPGEYVFFCSVPGHRAAGMEGVITAEGDPKTFEQAEAELAGAEGEGEAA